MVRQSEPRRPREGPEDLASRRYENSTTKLALMAQDISYMKEKIDDIQSKITDDTINPFQFSNLKSRVNLLEKVVYSFIGIVMTAVIVAIVAGAVHAGNVPAVK